MPNRKVEEIKVYFKVLQYLFKFACSFIQEMVTGKILTC